MYAFKHLIISKLVALIKMFLVSFLLLSKQKIWLIKSKISPKMFILYYIIGKLHVRRDGYWLRWPSSIFVFLSKHNKKNSQINWYAAMTMKELGVSRTALEKEDVNINMWESHWSIWSSAFSTQFHCLICSKELHL